MLFAPGALTTRMPRALAVADIDVVDARAGTRHDPELAPGFQEIRVDVGRATDEQRVRISKIVDEISGLAAGACVDHPARFTAEQVEGRRRQVVGNNDFQSG